MQASVARYGDCGTRRLRQQGGHRASGKLPARPDSMADRRALAGARRSEALL